MSDKKTTDIMLDRIKYYVNAVENGENTILDYDFTINLYRNDGKMITINDNYNRAIS